MHKKQLTRKSGKATTKGKSVSLPKLLKKAEYYFNKWVREVRDVDNPCICCGKYYEHYDAGHYVPVGKSSYLRFHEDNVHLQSKQCNHFDKFMLVGYRKRLIEKIGLEKVEWLEDNRHHVKRWSRSELEEIILKYKQ